MPINDVDALVTEIVRRAKVNPRYFTIKVRHATGSREALEYNNPYAGEWLPPAPE